MPPLAIAESSTARLPAAKARMRKSRRLNIGSATRVSMNTKTTSTATPPAIIASTNGFAQPMAELP